MCPELAEGAALSLSKGHPADFDKRRPGLVEGAALSLSKGAALSLSKGLSPHHTPKRLTTRLDS